MHTDWYYMTISYGSNIISYHSKTSSYVPWLQTMKRLQLWPAIWKPTICKKIWFCRMGFGCRHTFFFPIFFSCHFMKVWSFLCSFMIFHCNTMLFNYCNDREKEETPVLASFMHGLTVIIDQLKSTSCEQSPWRYPRPALTHSARR